MSDKYSRRSEYKTGTVSSGRSILNPEIMLSLLLKNWYVFVISIAIGLFLANFYLGHTLPVYLTSSTILINETGERSIVNNDELLQGLGLPGGLRNIENQLQILSARSITERALRELPFKVDYYIKTIRNRLSLYPDIPAKIVTDNNIPLPENVEFSISFLGNNMFQLTSESEYFIYSKKAAFGEIIEMPEGNYRISLISEEWFKRNPEEKLYFIINSEIGLINYYNSRLNVELLTRGGSMVYVSLTGTNRAKDAEYLTKHVNIFQSISLEKKNTEANRRIQFIDEQLVGISDSLMVTENRLQQFRSSHRIMDVSSQGDAIITQMTLLENERARLSLEADYYDYLSDYLAKDLSSELPIVPITMGINDPGLTRLVSELSELQGQLLSRGAGELNPIQNLITQRVRSAKDALMETLNGLRRANTIAVNENQNRLDRVNAQAAQLPFTERQLLGIERKFRLNDELYTYLLETRAEQQMQKASNMADSEVVEPADVRYSMMVAPSPPMAYLLGLMGGSGLPLLVIIFIFIFDKRVKEDELKRIRNISTLGSIPHSSPKGNRIVLDYPDSSVSEAFRLLRSKLQFYTKEEKSPVIVVTSAMPGDGKTFTAINIASVYSLLGKNTVLVGFDLRKPRIFDDFGLTNEKGLSTWLIGQSSLEEVIQPTGFDNFSVISAGPIPPNPSELTALDKTKELFEQLRNRFECIVVDTSPIGVVSDTFHIAALASTSLLVVRHKHTHRDLLDTVLPELTPGAVKGLTLVVNDVKSGSRGYSYGEKYGYMSQGKKKKDFFRKTPKSGKE